MSHDSLDDIAAALTLFWSIVHTVGFPFTWHVIHGLSCRVFMRFQHYGKLMWTRPSGAYRLPPIIFGRPGWLTSVMALSGWPHIMRCHLGLRVPCTLGFVSVLFCAPSHGVFCTWRCIVMLTISSRLSGMHLGIPHMLCYRALSRHRVSPSTMEHAMQCFARLVRLLLGPEAIADRKLEYGKQLLVLGMLACPFTHSCVCQCGGSAVCGLGATLCSWHKVLLVPRQGREVD